MAGGVVEPPGETLKSAVASGQSCRRQRVGQSCASPAAARVDRAIESRPGEGEVQERAAWRSRKRPSRAGDVSERPTANGPRAAEPGRVDWSRRWPSENCLRRAGLEPKPPVGGGPGNWSAQLPTRSPSEPISSHLISSIWIRAPAAAGSSHFHWRPAGHLLPGRPINSAACNQPAGPSCREQPVDPPALFCADRPDLAP